MKRWLTSWILSSVPRLNRGIAGGFAGMMALLIASLGARALPMPTWQQITASGNYSFSGRTETAAQVIIFQDGFETGDCSRWTSIPWGCDGSNLVAVNTTRPHTGTYSIDIHYTHTGPGDLNRYPSKTTAASYNHFFVRAYHRFEEASPPATAAGKKLYWFADSNDSNTGYQILLSGNSHVSGSPINLNVGVQTPDCNGGGSASWASGTLATVNRDTWYSIEAEIQLNTPGVANGIYRVWLDGVPIYNQTDRNLRYDCTADVDYFRICGIQSNLLDASILDEHRFCDDAVVATGYIGP